MPEQEQEAQIRPPDATATKAEGDAVLKAARAEFNKLLAKQNAEQAAPKKSKKEEAVSASTEDASEEAGPAESEKQELAPEKPKELKGLRQRLALAGLPRKVIDSMTEDEVSSVWEKQEERERKAEDAIRRASELERTLQSKAAGQSETQTGVPTEELDLDDVVAELDQFGEEESKQIAKAFSKLVAPLREENRAIREVIEKAQKHGEEQLSRTQRARLAEKLPMLKENGRAWESMWAESRDLMRRDPQKFSTVESAVDDVFQSRYGDVLEAVSARESAEEVATKEEAGAKARISASSMSQPNTRKITKTYSKHDAARATFEHLKKNHDDVEGARRLYGSYHIQ